MPKIVVIVEGGVVQNVYTDTPQSGVRLAVADYDRKEEDRFFEMGQWHDPDSIKTVERVFRRIDADNDMNCLVDEAQDQKGEN